MKVLTVFGTRPEAIKMAPVIRRLERSGRISSVVCSAGQHRELLDPVVRLFGVPIHYDFALMRPDQHPTAIIAGLLERLRPVFAAETPDWVLVHGDTTTALGTALAAFHEKIRIGHVEAGLRSFDLSSPFPEEMNRSVVDRLSDALFAPTRGARQNLVAEGLDPSRIVVTGNTVVDALHDVIDRIARDPAVRQRVEAALPTWREHGRTILVTIHRRESFGQTLEEICRALVLATERLDVDIVYTTHPNPNVLAPVRRMLAGRPRIHLVDPQPYDAFVYLMSRSDLIVTDSGGIQEEAPALGKPVLVLREVTERPEALSSGLMELVSPKIESILAAIARRLACPAGDAAGVPHGNPYGDGRAAERIVAHLEHLRDHPVPRGPRAGSGGGCRSPVDEFDAATAD